MSDLVERLRDLHKQATVERSHYYVGKCALDAADRIEALEAVLRKYSTHTSDCGWRYGHDCDCGIVDIRTALAPEQDK